MLNNKCLPKTTLNFETMFSKYEDSYLFKIFSNIFYKEAVAYSLVCNSFPWFLQRFSKNRRHICSFWSGREFRWLSYFIKKMRRYTQQKISILFQLCQWHHGIVVIATSSNNHYTTAPLTYLPVYCITSLINSGSAQVQILLAACWRFAMVRISDKCPG